MLCFAANCLAAGSDIAWNHIDLASSRTWVIIADVTSDDAAGTASEAIAATDFHPGYLMGVETKPDSGGTAPDNNYTVTVASAQGSALLGGACTGNQGNAASEFSLPLDPDGLGYCPFVNAPPTVATASMGNSNGTTIYLYIRY